MIKKELILQYFDNTISADDAVLVQDWAEQNPEDFRLMQELWAADNKVAEIQLFDTELAWSSFMDALETPAVEASSSDGEHLQDDDGAPEETEGLAKRVTLWKKWGPAAMAATAFIVVVVLYFLWPTDQYVTHFANAQTDQIILPDSTIVSLEEGSEIKYPKSFDKKEKRIVNLDGIAVFDVASYPNKPFIVEAAGMGVKVLGTIFELDAVDSVQTGVKNIEGLIRFFELANEESFIDVKEGESFIFDGNGFTETTAKPQIFYFSPPPLPYHTVREVVDYLNKITDGQTVAVGENFDWQRELQVSLETNNLEELIRAIKKKASITLVNKGCSECYEIHRFRVR